MKTLRLVVTYDCVRDCAKCCNKHNDYLPEKVKPISENFLPQALDNYDQIVVTGGEPMMYFDKLIDLSKRIDLAGCMTSIVNTAMTSITIDEFNSLCAHYDGVTLTIYDQKAMEDFAILCTFMNTQWELHWMYEDSSLRVNIFDNVYISPNDLNLISYFWKVRKGYKWNDIAPLPKHETLLKLEELWTKK